MRKRSDLTQINHGKRNTTSSCFLFFSIRSLYVFPDRPPPDWEMVISGFPGRILALSGGALKGF